jgi:hypothetical protein
LRKQIEQARPIQLNRSGLGLHPLEGLVFIPSMPSAPSHSWKFFRAGGFDQVKLATGADLANLSQLDLKLWVALACPTTGLEFDARTLALIDADKDGRIRAPEFIAAIQWAVARLRSPDSLVSSKDALPLAAIDDSKPEAKVLLASARKILACLGKPTADAVTVEDVADNARIFAQTVFNGDGVIVPESATDDAARSAIADIIATVGSVADRSGKPGVDAAKVDQFMGAAAALDAWFARTESDPAILPLGPGTAAAADAVRTVKSKVDDFFGRCRLAAFDGRALAALNRDEKDYAAVAAKDLPITAADVASFPLATVGPGRSLPLAEGVNPAWAAALATFHAAAVVPLVGPRAVLSEADWLEILRKLGPHECWRAGKAGADVEKLGIERVRALLQPAVRESLAALIARDKAEEAESNAIADVERLVRFHRDLFRLATNFVNFKDLYDGNDPAIFQVGTLYLDQRSCTLCLAVEDAGRHASMAGLAGAYLAYVDCTRRATGEKRSIVAIFSQGDDQNLMVGRNGVFFDRQGRDWDATISKIVSNPISLRQAFLAPYKKFARLIEEQVAKRAAAADSAADAKLANAAEKAANADKAKPAEAKKVDVGAVAALGVAFGAIGGFVTAIVTGVSGAFSAHGPLAIVGIVLGIMAVISGPSMILAYIKLRKRNLGPILDANGWALNAPARINVPFGTSLTGIAKLPPGASIDFNDSFAEKSVPWKRWVVLALLAYLGWGYYKGRHDANLPPALKSTRILGSFSPMATSAPAAPDAASTNAPAAPPKP